MALDADDDEVVLRALYAQFGGPLFGYGRRALGDASAAEELVQDVLLRAWRHGHRLERAEDLGPWLFTVARNLVIDRQRRTRSRPPPAGAHDDTGSPAATDDIIDQFGDKEGMLDALRQLPETHRSVILEIFYRDRSVHDAAAVLGIAEGTVKSRLHYGLRALKLILEPSREVQP